MLLDVVHRVSNRHSYHRINSPSAAVTTSLLFTLSFCPRVICREACQGRYLAPCLNSKGTSYFQRKRGYYNLSFISSLCVKSRCSKKQEYLFLPLSTLVWLFFPEDAALSGTTDSSPKAACRHSSAHACSANRHF